MTRFNRLNRIFHWLSAVGMLAALVGLALTVPRVGTAGPGYLAKEIAPVIGWAIIGTSCWGFWRLTGKR